MTSVIINLPYCLFDVSKFSEISLRKIEQSAVNVSRFFATFCCIAIILIWQVLLSTDLYARSASSGAGLRYENAVVSEDITWRGVVAIKGSVTIAPQATVRIEPGTTILFSSPSKRQLSRLVVMGRIQALGSNENPIRFTAENKRWGGILLLSSMKKNQFEYCHIEYAESAIEARFSSLSTSKTVISNATAAILLYDSIASSSHDKFTDCETAYSSTASEVELRNTEITDNQQGVVLLNSSAVISSLLVNKNKKTGVFLNKSRFTMVSSNLSENAIGFESLSGEGEIRLCRFSGNAVTGLKLTDSPLKITRSRIVENGGDGIQLVDNRPVFWGNSVFGNRNFNLSYSGREPFSAVQNWWGSVEESVIEGKISANFSKPSWSLVMISPWLMESPQLP